MSDIIQSDYEQLEAIARRFEKSEAATETTLKRLRERAEALRDTWKGSASARFQAEMGNELLPALQRLTEALGAASATTRQIATIFRDAEKEAEVLFKGERSGSSDGEDTFTGALDNTMSRGFSPTSIMSPVAASLGALMKGIVADTLLPQRYVLQSKVLVRKNSALAILMDMHAGRPGRGNWLVRFDRGHGATPWPHLNFNSDLPGYKDPHTPISPRLLNAAGRGARLLEGARRITLPLALATDVFRLGSAFQADGYQVGSETTRAIGGVAGGWAGAFAGAKAGAAGGAWVGGIIGTLVFPAVGTAAGAGIGGFLGGLIGGVGGAVAGNWIGEQIGEEF